jgi:ribosomal protein L18E
VHAHAFSKPAREKIEAAGGSCQVIDQVAAEPARGGDRAA